jgi:hypothetical protein
MNVEIGAEAALFPNKEYIIGIAVAVKALASLNIPITCIYSEIISAKNL